MTNCFWCSEEIHGYRAVAFIQVLGERVPIHLTPCLGIYQAYQHSLKPAPAND